MSLLDDLFRSGALRVIDHALAQSLRRLDPATPDAVLAAAALASFAVGQGNAAFDPAQPQLLFDAAIDWPAPQAWLEALSESRWVGMPEAMMKCGWKPTSANRAPGAASRAASA